MDGAGKKGYGWLAKQVIRAARPVPIWKAPSKPGPTFYFLADHSKACELSVYYGLKAEMC